MHCIICQSKINYFFSKLYDKSPFIEMMKNIGEVNYYKCENCGFTISKTHQELDNEKFEKLNYEFHHYLENGETDVNQPPYLEQSMMINVLLKNQILDYDMLDYAGGYGTLSKSLKKYFNISLPVYDPYVQSDNFANYIDKKDLKTYKTVVTSALFEHILTREGFDEINTLVDGNEGAMVIHTVICENIPKNPDWFYLEPPVHTTFHTNKSMSILMEQWGYKASIYCLSAKSWILLKEDSEDIKEKVESINKEFQTQYLIYKKGFVDYWKGF